MAKVQTSGNPMNLVLNKEVDQGYQGTKESTSDILSVPDGLWVRRAESNTAQCPGESAHNVRDHKNVVPIMIVGRCDVRPATACQGSKKARRGNEAREFGARLSTNEIEQAHERESRSLTNWSAYAGSSNTSHPDLRSRVPDVMAMKIMKNDRSGYRSPIVAETDGNHSCGYP